MPTSSLRRITLCVAALAATTQAVPGRAAEVPQPASSIAAFVTAASQRFGVPEAWIYAVMRVESAGNARAVSPKGATGLMQIMPATWADLRARYGLGDDIYDARENILAGAAYMRELYDRYGAPGFLAAYNAGPLRYEAYLRSGQSLPAETRLYLARLSPVTGAVSVRLEAAKRSDPLGWTRCGVFVGETSAPSFSPQARVGATASTVRDATAAPSHPAHPGLFVWLSSRQPQ